MINSPEFSKRLEKVIKFHDETASSFAEKIGVQRSSISHILSGRNKPSLDFVMKVLEAFPDVELYWLLNGKGTFPKSETKIMETPTPSPSLVSNKNSEKTANQILEDLKTLPSNSSKEIDRIVIFYKDGTFQNFNN
ncbi:MULTISPECIES: helix-turn-helix domain-containing protein [Bizionia]|uniref:Helix-turn-helix transcriptional regulator n=1 Tax=Bizionia algoritergicola TaxID=291187 RepID=A0A5D0QWV4_9FLAO|nr:MULTISPECIES: helix-turn-helix transcriptional regulator [Bizionia]OBX24157.1 transcriptional regulator [Bizionia sp. APA-3]TYB73670.1 helix-turn-helix transcriptional regulator [Bizionia algoritergicola]